MGKEGGEKIVVTSLAVRANFTIKMGPYLRVLQMLKLVEHPHLHLQPLPYESHLVSSILGCQVLLTVLFILRICAKIYSFAWGGWRRLFTIFCVT